MSCCSISFCYNLIFLGFYFLYLPPLSRTRSFYFRPQHIRSHLYHCMSCTRIQCRHLIFRIGYTSLLPGHHSNTLQRTEAQSGCTQKHEFPLHSDRLIWDRKAGLSISCAEEKLYEWNRLPSICCTIKY